MMPNNVAILAYIQGMKDRTNCNILWCKERNGANPVPHEAHLKDLENLEKFIKGGK